MKKRVLVVDDELDMRIFITTLLETNGYQTTVAVNGEEGIRLAREGKPAAVILDVMMPRQEGTIGNHKAMRRSVTDCLRDNWFAFSGVDLPVIYSTLK